MLTFHLVPEAALLKLLSALYWPFDVLSNISTELHGVTNGICFVYSFTQELSLGAFLINK